MTPNSLRAEPQTVFVRTELDRIMQLYGRMVAAGEWRDYALHFGRNEAIFSAFRRASEKPEYRLVKEPALRARQGQYKLVGEQGQTLKRGDDLASVLAPATRRLMKAV